LADFVIKKGLDIQLEGAPSTDLEVLEGATRFSVYPADFEGIKPRLKVKEGDPVKRGEILFENKRNEKMLFRSPCAGTVTEIRLGERRIPLEIVIEKAELEESISLERVDLNNATRESLVEALLQSGLWPLIRQRPFSKIADPEKTPKAIFVNAMNSAPFQADPTTLLKGNEEGFKAGIEALGKLTEGDIHVCSAPGLAIPAGKQSTFEGPHPTGNTSIHINRISPMQPHDTVYALRLQDVIKIGTFIQSGELPTEEIFCLAGAAVKPAFRKHYKNRIGASIESLIANALEDKEVRIVSGTMLTGNKVPVATALHFYDQEINVIEEDRKRIPFGWTMPGLLQYSAHRTNLSSWIAKTKKWNLGTNIHGGHRAMVMTGWYDRYMPLNILTDYLVRAVLAHDTDEAVQLGILETDPEDFALCTFIDPAKNDLGAIIKRGLQEIEEEGI
jgi:Na+-transporting NADH:ubiquinone oxidoreductase subunit A